MTGRLIGGGILILLGLAFLADQLIPGLALGANIWKLWPLFVIVPGVGAIVAARRLTSHGITLVLLGLAFLVATWFELWGVIWPVFLIIGGLGILLSFLDTRRDGGTQSGTSAENVLDASANFGGVELRSTAPALSGGSVSATFGTIRVDLRDATLQEGGATIDADATFGTIDIVVPRSWRVAIAGDQFLGSITDRTVVPPAADAPVLRIKADATFGSVTVTD